MSTALVLWYVGIATLSTGVIWKGSELLERSSERLAGHYGLPPIVRTRGAPFPVVGALLLSLVVEPAWTIGTFALPVLLVVVVRRPASTALPTAVAPHRRSLVGISLATYQPTTARIAPTRCRNLSGPTRSHSGRRPRGDGRSDATRRTPVPMATAVQRESGNGVRMGASTSRRPLYGRS